MEKKCPLGLFHSRPLFFLRNNNINSFKEATTELYPKDPDGTGTNLDSNEKNHSKTTTYLTIPSFSY